MTGSAPARAENPPRGEETANNREDERTKSLTDVDHSLTMKMLASLRSAGDRHRVGMSDRHHRNAHIPGAGGKLVFDGDMLQRHLDDITGLLASLSLAARKFGEEQKQACGK